LPLRACEFESHREHLKHFTLLLMKTETDLDKLKTLDELHEELKYYRERFIPTGNAGSMWRSLRVSNLLMEINRRKMEEK
jgi:hypothetical protein